MSIELWVGIAALAVAVVALAVGLYAIRDVREQVRRHVIEAQRDAVYIEAVNQLCWEFIEPLPMREMYSPEIYILIAKHFKLRTALDSDSTLQASKELIENASLETASAIVDSQKAEWKHELDFDKVRAMLDSWRNEKAKARMSKIFHGKNRTLL